MAFENPALLYEGPDPTADAFLPMRWGPVPQGDIIPLPAVEQLTEEFIYSPELPPEMVVAPGYSGNLTAPTCGELRDHKSGFFQKASFTATWLARGSSSDGFGITELDLFTAVAVPLPTREWPLVISPTFNARYLDGPSAPDLPPELYETYLDFVWLPRFNSRWSAVVSVAPSLYTDFHVDVQEAWRLTGRGMIRFDCIPERLELLAGVLYLDRQDVRLLPVAGLIWTPAFERRYELVFPRPKLAHMIACSPTFQDWLYLGAEFGGNTFAFEQDGQADLVTLRDYRIYLGVERKLDGGAGFRFEAGYVFSRSIELASSGQETIAPATAHLRIGAAY